MLVGMTADKPKRKPAGAAVPGAVERPILYPKTLCVMLSVEMYDEIGAIKKATGRTKAEIAREWMERGRPTIAS